jgi:hypothetical protein
MLQEAGLVGDDGPELNVTLELGDGMPHTSVDALYRARKVAVCQSRGTAREHRFHMEP